MVGRGGGGVGRVVGIGGPNRSAKTCNKLLPQVALPGKGQRLWGRGWGSVTTPPLVLLNLAIYEACTPFIPYKRYPPPPPSNTCESNH